MLNFYEKNILGFSTTYYNMDLNNIDNLEKKVNHRNEITGAFIRW